MGIPIPEKNYWDGSLISLNWTKRSSKWQPGGLCQYKNAIFSYSMKNSIVLLKLSNPPHTGNSHIGNTASLYWNGLQIHHWWRWRLSYWQLLTTVITLSDDNTDTLASFLFQCNHVEVCCVSLLLLHLLLKIFVVWKARWIPAIVLRHIALAICLF